jgi:transcriptional regulator with XRE-family HTH domain
MSIKSKKPLKQLDVDAVDERYYALLLSTFRKVQAIVAFRKSEGYSQADIAQRIGMDEAQLSRLLKGRSNVTFRTLNRIARAADSRLEINVKALEDVAFTNLRSSRDGLEVQTIVVSAGGLIQYNASMSAPPSVFNESFSTTHQELVNG